MGAIFRYELLRLGRRSHHFWLRVAYALILLGLLYWTRFSLTISRDSPPIDEGDIARSYATVLVLGQYLFAILITPALVGEAIAEEMQPGRSEALFTTPLSLWGILLGKLCARLAGLLLFLLTSVPILSILFPMGGVWPTFVWCSFAVTVGTVI